MFGLYREALLNAQPLSIRLFDDWINLAGGHTAGECGYYGRCTPQFVLESDGSAYPCDFYALDEWRLGNINEQSFFTLGKSPVRAAFCDVPAIQPCSACPWRLFCRYGCRRERHSDGDVVSNRWCLSYRMFFEACGNSLLDLAARKAVSGEQAAARPARPAAWGNSGRMDLSRK